MLAALQTLPEIDRAAVLLRAEEGMSYDEVAAALEISPVAARVKVRRARLKLAEAMRIGGPGILNRNGTTIMVLLILDAPVIGIAWWVTAAIMWIWHVRIRRRLRVSGL